MSRRRSCARKVRGGRQSPEQNAKSKDRPGPEVEERPGKRPAKVTQNRGEFWGRPSRGRHLGTGR